MKKQEYEFLNKDQFTHWRFSVKDLYNLQPRTLLYGYTLERNTWHVYLMNDLIYILEYGYEDCVINYKSDTSHECGDIIPTKRLYPERCDYETCQLLLNKGCSLPFTTFTENIEVVNFYGLTHLNLNVNINSTR